MSLSFPCCFQSPTLALVGQVRAQQLERLVWRYITAAYENVELLLFQRLSSKCCKQAQEFVFISHS